MTAFSRHTIETPHVGNIIMPGTWRPNGSGTTAAANIHANWIESVDQTATGVYLVTLKAEFWNMGLIYVSAQLRMGTATLSRAQIAAVDMAAGTIVVGLETQDATSGKYAPADIASDASNWVDMLFVGQYNPVVDGSNVQ